MLLRSLLIFFIACICAGVPGVSQAIVKAVDYGVEEGGRHNAAAIRKAIDACRGKKSAVLLLPGGRIDVWPDEAEKRELYISNCTENDTLSKTKSIAFSFDNCKNIMLDGNNTLVVLHGKMVSFAVIKSVNINIRNIRFDYERPTMSELTIRSVSDSAIETEIHPDSKYAIDSGRISFYGEGWKNKSYHTILFDPQKQRLHYSTLKPLLESRAVQVSPLRVRFEDKFANSKYRPGDVLTFRDPYRDNCGGFISRSKNIALDNVKMHYMHGLGIVSQFSENISLFKVTVAPRENSGRIIASFADCFHFSGCKGLVKIDSCFTSGSHDDPVNVHGTHLQVTAIKESRKLIVRFMHPQTYGFEAFFAGDSIAFIHPQTLMPIVNARLKSARMVSRREMEIEVQGMLPAEARVGLCLENLSWTPEVVIRNSRFERTNTRGLLITTRRKVLIENNSFYHTGMFPVLIANDASSWFESGAVQDVTIRNNLFEDCGFNSGSGAINIAPENHELIAGNTVHRNIRITNNRFKLINNGLLSARSTDHLLFAGNKITYSNGKGNNRPAISLTACKNVVIEKNGFDATDSPVVNTSKMTTADLKTDLTDNVRQ